MSSARMSKKILCIVMSLVLAIGLMPSVPTMARADSGARKADVVFVIDSTGSMYGDIDNVKDSIGTFVSVLEGNGVDMRIGIVDYRDIYEDGVDSTRMHVNSRYSPWFTSADEVRAILDDIDADGGGDTPESLVDALGLVAGTSMKFRSDAYKFAFVLTDASYKAGNTRGYPDMKSVVTDLASQGVAVSIVTPSEYFDDSYSPGDEGESDSIFDAMSVASSVSAEGAGSLVAASLPSELIASVQANEPDTEAMVSSNGKPNMSQLSRTDRDALGLSAQALPGVADYVITEGATINVMTGELDPKVVEFVPKVSGVYAFSSAGDSDPYCSLSKADGAELYSDDDGGSGLNFVLRAKLREGVHYYYTVKDLDAAETIISVTMTKEADITDAGSGVAENISYREIVAMTNGILLDLRDDFLASMEQFAEKVMSLSLKTSRKAIYVLPGYMGSQLFDKSSGEKVWVDGDFLKDDAIRQTLPGGESSILLRDDEGTSEKIKSDLSQDPYGAEDNYKTLMERLKTEFGNEYDVVFFAYDWLGDLSDAAAKLESHIKTNRYDEVVLVTHSTGGLLASNFLARSRENCKLVSKAILVAPPLYGTYSALQPIETGKTETSDAMIEKYGVPSFLMGFVHGWVKAITKNSPTTYQLLPSEEYLKATAIVYRDDLPRAVTTQEDYYRILNGSGNINAKLTNGNKRSHATFRNDILGGDIVKVLQKVDTVIVGSDSGSNTPAIACYEGGLFGSTSLRDIVYKNDGDGTVMGLSAFARADGKTTKLATRNFPGIDHGQLVSWDEPLDYICTTIDGLDGSLKASSVSSLSAQAALDALDAPMASMTTQVKYTITAPTMIDVKVIGLDGVERDAQSSASGVTFTPLEADVDGGFRALLYTPASGYKINLYAVDASEDDARIRAYLDEYGYDANDIGDEEAVTAVAGDVVVEAATLSDDGFKTATASYEFALPTATGESKEEALSTLDADEGATLVASIDEGTGVTQANLGALAGASTASVIETHANWSISQSLDFSAPGQAAALELFGSDAENGSVVSSDLTLGSSNTDVAQVDSDGTVRATGFGRAVISAYEPGSGRVETCEVVVKKYATSMSIPDASLDVNERLVAEPVFDEPDVTQTDLVLQSSDPSIAEIDGEVVVGRSPGKARISAVAEGGASTTFDVEVASSSTVAATGVSVSAYNTSISVGATTTATARVLPDDASDRVVEWHVGGSGALEIVSNGDDYCVVRGVAAGSDEVIAVTSDGGFTDAVRISVTGSESVSSSTTGKPVPPAVSTTPSTSDKSSSVVSNNTAKKATSKKSAKKKNTLKVKTKAIVLRYKVLKQKTQKITAKKAFTVTKAKGKVTYKKTKGAAKINVSKTGKVTVKKGLKRGVYKVGVNVTAKGTSVYKPITKKVTLKVSVK